MISRNILFGLALLFNLFLISNIHYMFIFMLIKIIIIYVTNDYTIAMLLTLKLIIIYVMLHYYFVEKKPEGFWCIPRHKLVSHSYNTRDCQDYCGKIGNCKYTLQPYDKKDAKRRCYILAGNNLNNNVVSKKHCKSENMELWENKKYKPNQYKLSFRVGGVSWADSSTTLSAKFKDHNNKWSKWFTFRRGGFSKNSTYNKVFMESDTGISPKQIQIKTSNSDGVYYSNIKWGNKTIARNGWFDKGGGAVGPESRTFNL
jgi:hypothetical protein